MTAFFERNPEVIDGRTWRFAYNAGGGSDRFGCNRWFFDDGSGADIFRRFRLVELRTGGWAAIPPGVVGDELTDEELQSENKFEAEDWRDIASAALAFLHMKYGTGNN